jgi:hypothetical protein
MSELLAAYHGDHVVIDCWTVVLNREPGERYYPMIAADHDGYMFYQHTEGYYDPDGDNPHLGGLPRLMPEQLMERILEEL